MSAPTKPAMDTELIALPELRLECGHTDCSQPPSHIFLHAICDGGNPVCAAHHARESTWLLEMHAEGAAVIHTECDEAIAPPNYTFRAI